MSFSDPVRISRLLTEGVAIIASILIAFFLDASWASHKERVQEREILEGLSDEFTANSDALTASFESGRSQVRILERLLTMNERDFLDLSDQESIGLAEVFSQEPFDPEQAELDAVIASGSFGILRDARLKRALSGWRRLLEKLEKQESAQLDATNQLLTQLRGHGVAEELVVALGSGEAGGLRNSWVSAMSDPEVRDAVALTLLIRNSYLTGPLQIVREEADSVKVMLNR